MERPPGAPRHWIESKLMGYLHPDEHDEYVRLRRREDRGTITAQQDVRLKELGDLMWPRLLERRASRPIATPENDLLLYAQQIGEQMRTRSGAESAEQLPDQRLA